MDLFSIIHGWMITGDTMGYPSRVPHSQPKFSAERCRQVAAALRILLPLLFTARPLEVAKLQSAWT